MMDEFPDDLSEAELADWQYAHRDEMDAEDGERVEAEISPQLSVTMSFRLPGAEADAIRAAARAAGVTLSEWIRMACADASETDGGQGQRRRVDTELDRAQKQLDAVRRRLDAVRRHNRRIVRAGRPRQAP